MKQPSQPDWLSLPQELLEKISHGVSVSCGDYVRFRAVCKYWRCATPKIPPQSHLDPWLMHLSSDYGYNNGDFYSLTDHKVYHIDLPEIRSKRCVGCSQGWLCLASLEEEEEEEEDGIISASISILNPITKAHIQLPPITNIPEIFVNVCTYYSHMVRNLTHKEMIDILFRRLFILSEHPKSNHYMILIGDPAKLAFCSAGDSMWSIASKGTADFPERYDKDVIYHIRRLYDICNGLMISSIITISPHYLKMEETANEKPIYGWTNYLVEVGGELMLVVALILYPHSNPTRKHRSLSFHPYKIRLGGEGGKGRSEEWLTKTTSLGDYSVFVGRNSSFSISTKDTRQGWLKPNCIYFSELSYDFADAEGNMREYDVGVFNLGDGSIEPLMYDAQRFCCRPIIWIRPSLY